MQFLWSLTLFFGTAFGEVSKHNATSHDRSLFNLVDCGVCKNVPKSTCQWCSGSGGPAAIGSASSVPAETSNLVDCGVCKNVPKSTCQWCSGTGGPATVGSAASPASSNLVDCGVCKNVPKSTCQWCDGAGGNAPVNSRPATPDSGSPASSGMYDGSCPAGLVNCGVCRCTVPSACKTCDGSGGPAEISTSDAWSMVPSFTMLLVAFVIGS